MRYYHLYQRGPKWRIFCPVVGGYHHQDSQAEAGRVLYWFLPEKLGGKLKKEYDSCLAGLVVVVATNTMTKYPPFAILLLFLISLHFTCYGLM